MHTGLLDQYARPFFNDQGLTIKQGPEFEMAPDEIVRTWEREADAINYSVEEHLKKHPGLTYMAIADMIGVARFTLTKMRQDQIPVPKGKLRTFMRVCKSVAVLQFHAQQSDLVLKTKEQENKQLERIANLEKALRQAQTPSNKKLEARTN